MNPETHRVYIVKGTDAGPTILETYKGGVSHTTASLDFIASALIGQARTKISKLGDDLYLATNSPHIAQKYHLTLIQTK